MARIPIVEVQPISASVPGPSPAEVAQIPSLLGGPTIELVQNWIQKEQEEEATRRRLEQEKIDNIAAAEAEAKIIREQDNLFLEAYNTPFTDLSEVQKIPENANEGNTNLVNEVLNSETLSEGARYKLRLKVPGMNARFSNRVEQVRQDHLDSNAEYGIEKTQSHWVDLAAKQQTATETHIVSLQFQNHVVTSGASPEVQAKALRNFQSNVPNRKLEVLPLEVLDLASTDAEFREEVFGSLVSTEDVTRAIMNRDSAENSIANQKFLNRARDASSRAASVLAMPGETTKEQNEKVEAINGLLSDTGGLTPSTVLTLQQTKKDLQDDRDAKGNRREFDQLESQISELNNASSKGMWVVDVENGVEDLLSKIENATYLNKDQRDELSSKVNVIPVAHKQTIVNLAFETVEDAKEIISAHQTLGSRGVDFLTLKKLLAVFDAEMQDYIGGLRRKLTSGREDGESEKDYEDRIRKARLALSPVGIMEKISKASTVAEYDFDLTPEVSLSPDSLAGRFIVEAIGLARGSDGFSVEKDREDAAAHSVVGPRSSMALKNLFNHSNIDALFNSFARSQKGAELLETIAKESGHLIKPEALAKRVRDLWGRLRKQAFESRGNSGG